jgi:hypothetical protein
VPVSGPYGTNHSVVFLTARLSQNASRYECDLARRKNLAYTFSVLNLSRSLHTNAATKKG